MDGEADGQCLVEVGDGEASRIEGVEIFAAFPGPEGNARQWGETALGMRECVGLNA